MRWPATLDLASDREKPTTSEWWRSWWQAFLSTHEFALVRDYWLPFILGLLELTAYPYFIAKGAWILEPSATGLCKPDLHVFAKLFEDCLKRGLEAQAFSGREIGGHDDVLDFFAGHFVDVDLTT